MKSILVIDDDESLREVICKGLQGAEFTVDEATNGKEAIELASRILPDLIITDLVMDKLNGFSLIERLRKDVSTATIPIIVMSGLRPEEGYRRSMELGADDYLVKPFEMTQLLAAVKARIQRADSEVSARNEKLALLRSKISRSIPHEFRTPLAIITMAGELLEANPIVSQDVHLQDIVARLKIGTDRLKRTTEHFVLFSRVELWNNDPHMKEYFRKETCDINESYVIRLAHRQATKNGRRSEDYRVSIEPTILKMHEEHATLMMTELIDNAFRFSQPGTLVTVEGIRQESSFVLKIADGGRGMSNAEVRDIDAFMQFRREHYEQQGMGLGLTIAKRLIDLYDGLLKIDSALDAGTRIEVRVPVARRDEAGVVHKDEPG